MKSLLKFLAFVAVVAGCLGAILVFRDSRLEPMNNRTLLLELDREFTNLVASVLPSVVSIDAIPVENINQRARLLAQMLGLRPGDSLPQLGSGVIVSSDGYIATNFHVVDGAGAVRIHLNDGRILPARLIGSDRGSDLAILKVDADNLIPVRWADSDKVRVGQGVITVGNPLGLQETVTQGIISGKGRRASTEITNEFFQTDAAINEGNSGGPLLDWTGALIGVNNRLTADGEGISFAIPSNTVRRVFESIRDQGRFVRPWFGAVARPLTPSLALHLGMDQPRGALLLGTYENSPAALAGLRPGDIVLAFNGRPILDPIDLRNRVAESRIGERVDVLLARDGKEMTFKPTLTIQPEAGQTHGE